MRVGSSLFLVFFILVLGNFHSKGQCPSYKVKNDLILIPDDLADPSAVDIPILNLGSPESVDTLTWVWSTNIYNLRIVDPTSFHAKLDLSDFVGSTKVQQDEIILKPKDDALIVKCQQNGIDLEVRLKVKIFPKVRVLNNVITINGDEHNGIFSLMNFSGAGFSEPKIEIFDRWGTKVFESLDNIPVFNGTQNNGKILNTGTYVYGIKPDPDYPPIYGEITIIR